MQEELNAIAWKPDIRPRKMHGSRAPLQGYNDLLTLAPMPDSAIHQSVLHLTLETAALPDSMLHKAIRRLTPSPHLQAFSRPCSAILLVLFAGLCFMGVALAEEMSSTVQAPSTDGATTAATATPPPPGVPSGMANAEAGATTEPTSREGSPAPPGTAMTSPSMPPKNVDLSKEIGIPSSREDAAQGKGFGYETFSSGGLPINQGPVDDLYLLSPGDEIVVSIWGQLVETLNLVVSDEGFIDLPDNGGRIQTNGVTLRDLKPKVVQALSQIYAAYINAVDPPKSTAFVDIRVGKLRKLSILVVGEVNKPGAYTVSAGVANVINMLHNAGGVKTGGSLREIRIRRSNGKVDTVDLYGFLLTGDIDYRTIRLQPGDYIVVPLKQRSVTIEGEVRRPNQYEMIGNEGIRELLKFAGGFTPDAYLRQTQIKRYELNRGEIYLDVDLDRIVADPHEDYPLMDGDVIRIARNVQVRKNVVSIKGDGIIRPGTYEWQPGMTLNDLVQKAEGLREYAFLDRADLIRTENDFSKKLTVISLKALYTRNVSGNFDFSGNQGDNIPLREMDEVIIQSAYGMAGKERFVAMEGHVKEAGKFVLAKDMTLYDLIFARGGFQDAAFRKATFLDMGHIFRTVPGTVGRKIIPFRLGALLDKDASANMPLEENDVIRIYSFDEMRIKQQVTIDGLVNKPGTFDMVEDLTLEDLLIMAGGLQEGAEMTQAVIARADVGGNSRSMVVPIAQDYSKLTQDNKTRLEARDKISIVGFVAKDRYVTLAGHIKEPGRFILTKDMTLVDLIATRGGFQDPGFRRSVFPDMAHIFRTVPGTVGRKIIPFRLGALLDKDASANMPLEENDVIRIYSFDEMRIKQQVTIDGLVNKPGTFDMVEDLTLEDLILMAGGLRPDAFRVEAAIARSEKDDAQRESGTVTLTTFKVPVPKDFTSLPTEQRTHLKPDDRITIRALPGWERSASVLIEGEVMEPGNYSLLSASDRLTALIQRAGGLRKEALPEGITVKRKRTIVDMAASGTDAYYDITVNVSAALESPGGIEDIVLKPDDRIFVPTNPGVVEIRGAVNRELTVQHTPGKSLAEYIAMCGGYLDKADPAAVKVFAANKVAITAKARGKGKANLEIPAGSVIEVPFLRETERMLTVEVKGAVEKPAVMQHIEGARLGYYLNLSGGFKDEADIQDISVLLPDGGLLVKSGDQPFNPVIPGGSLVMVSTKPKAGAR